MRSAALAKSCLAIAARVCPALNALPSNLNVRLQLQADHIKQRLQTK